MTYTPASDVLVVGSVAYDAIQTPFGKGDSLLGGSASYASVATSFFATPRLVGIVGNDFRDVDLARFREREICLEGLEVDNSGGTFFWAGRYHENFEGRDTLETRLNVFDGYSPVLPDSYKEVDYVLLANIGPDLQLHVLSQMAAGHRPFVVADTMNLWIDIMQAKLLELLQHIDVLVLNDEEAEQLTGESNIFKSGPALQAKGPATVIVKKGAHGAVLFSGDERFILPAYPVTDLRDPTGAGDTFVGAFVGYLAQK